MIPSVPFDVFMYSLDWTGIPASFSVTIGGVQSIGGYGVVGDGQLATLWALGSVVTPTGGGGPVPTAKVLQGGVIGTAYSETVSAQGGTGPCTFAVTVGSLPAGMSLALDAPSGLWKITGTPTTAGTYDFTIQATDATGAVGSTDFEIGVAAPQDGATNYCIIN